MSCKVQTKENLQGRKACCGYSVEISERQAGIYELNAVTNDKYLSVFFLISSSLTP